MDTVTDYIPEPASEIGVGSWVSVNGGITAARIIHTDAASFTISGALVDVQTGNAYGSIPKTKFLWGHSVDLIWRPGDCPLEEIIDDTYPSAEALTPEPLTDDIVVRPSHYTRFQIEPIEFIMRNKLPFHAGNIIKYTCRAGHKLYEGKDATASEITDLEKVRRYAEMRINQLKKQEVL